MSLKGLWLLIVVKNIQLKQKKQLVSHLQWKKFETSLEIRQKKKKSKVKENSKFSKTKLI